VAERTDSIRIAAVAGDRIHHRYSPGQGIRTYPDGQSAAGSSSGGGRVGQMGERPEMASRGGQSAASSGGGGRGTAQAADNNSSDGVGFKGRVRWSRLCGAAPSGGVKRGGTIGIRFEREQIERLDIRFYRAAPVSIAPSTSAKKEKEQWEWRADEQTLRHTAEKADANPTERSRVVHQQGPRVGLRPASTRDRLLGSAGVEHQQSW
jgi:hypothetical protein